MSTTHIQPLPNVRGRMSYTELGEGKKRTRNIREKTNRIAAQMGDMGTREDFIRFCSAMRRQSQGTRLNEGYELRVSWSPEELSKDSPEDIQRACEYAHALHLRPQPARPALVRHSGGGLILSPFCRIGSVRLPSLTCDMFVLQRFPHIN